MITLQVRHFASCYYSTAAVHEGDQREIQLAGRHGILSDGRVCLPLSVEQSFCASAGRLVLHERLFREIRDGAAVPVKQPFTI